MPQIFVDPLTMREFERTSPSVFWLMPSPDLFGDTPLLYADGRSVFVFFRIYFCFLFEFRLCSTLFGECLKLQDLKT